MSLFFLRLFAATLVVGAVFVLTQDIQLCPTALDSLFNSKERDPASLPKGFESVFIETEDSKRIELWYTEPKVKKSDVVFMIFHGNGGTVDGFSDYQRWLRSLGISSVGVEYRGYGKSTGWPSERGFKRDADAAWRWLTEVKGITAENIALFGISLGTAPAARLASKHQVGTLVLLSPYTSIPDVVAGMSLLRFLKPFLWWELPTKKYVSELKETDLYLVHGRADTIIPFSHSPRIEEAYQGEGQVRTFYYDGVGHNDLFSHAYRDVGAALTEALADPEG